jgi:uroporphyrinogen-III synthase
MTLDLMGEDGWQHLLKSSLIVPHERIAQTAESLGFQQIQLTGSGDEALIAAIQSRS